MPALTRRLPGLLEQFDARQVLHVTHGSVLDRFSERLLATLWKHEEVYYTNARGALPAASVVLQIVRKGGNSQWFNQ